MPTLRAALGKEYLSFGDVAALAINPPGHVNNIPQRQSDRLPLALEAGALAARLLREQDIEIVRSLRPPDRMRGLTDMLQAAVGARELHDRQRREANAAAIAAERVQRISFEHARRDRKRDAGLRAPEPPRPR